MKSKTSEAEETMDKLKEEVLSICPEMAMLLWGIWSELKESQSKDVK